MKPLLPDEDLQPTHTPLGVDPTRQAETLKRIRELDNESRLAGWRRDELICAQALSHSVSRPDMARAIGVSRSRIDQIITAHMSRIDDEQYATMRERVARHLPTR